MGRFEYLIGQRPDRGLTGRPPRPVTRIPADVVASEWKAAPLSYLGRLLWTDVDRYLEFLAIAREDEPPRDATKSAQPRSDLWVRPSMFE